MQRGSEPISVAVKTAKKSTTAEEKGEFLREMNIMSKMVHPNIVQLYGVIRDGNNPTCITPVQSIITVFAHELKQSVCRHSI